MRVPSPHLLAGCRIELVGRVLDASNAAFLVRLHPGDAVEDAVDDAAGDADEASTDHHGSDSCDDGDSADSAPPTPLLGLYKPVRGEQPLWDFPDGALAFREVAASLIADAGGWRRVPTTVLVDGPFGVGSVQWWVSPDPTAESDGDEDDEDDAPWVSDDPEAGTLLWGGDGDVSDGPTHQGDTGDRTSPAEAVVVCRPGEVPEGYRVVVWGEGPDGRPAVIAHADTEELREMATLDIVLNNADRKGTHLIRDPDGRLWGVDHGVCLHHEDKLRTLLWGFAGEPLSDADVARVRRVRDGLCGDPQDENSLIRALGQLLTEIEVVAILERCEELLAAGRYPARPDRWGTIPWPPV